MKVSHQWLNRYVDLSGLNIDRLAEIMTEIGLEVEGVEKTENIKGGLNGIVVGEVIECSSHPNADRLVLTKVDIGTGEPLQIVCGAPNVAEGQIVPVATVGTSLYDKDGAPFTIKKGKIRGEVSEGMICAEDELGISDDHSGIMVLPDSYEIGKPLKKYIEVKEDYIIDIDLTPNRADAMSHKGVAFDISAYLKAHGEGNGRFSTPGQSEISEPEKELPVEVKVEDASACPRYSGVVLKNLKVQASPSWLQERLQSIGVRPVNNVVDTTNFILHDIGQPLHAFDFDKISEHTIRVKKLDSKIEFETLDGVKRGLTGEELMICDGNSNPLCMAGIFGGASSGVTENTTSIFLESAYFDAKTIRKASMHHQLRTDAAKIYEKGADPNNVIPALQSAVAILKEVAGAQVVSTVLDTLPGGMPRNEVQLHYGKLRQYVGLDIHESDIKRILQSLDMIIKEESENSLLLAVPTNKPDVLREVDVIEEFIRIYGLEEIPAPGKFSLTISPSQYPGNFHYREKVGQALTGAGLHEAMSLSIIPSAWYEERESEEWLVKINNTSNRELDALRPDMVSSSLSNIRQNLNRQQKDIGFFEFGKVYRKTEDEAYNEEERLAIALTGHHLPTNWLSEQDKETDFFVVKSYVQRVFELLGINGYQSSELHNEETFTYGVKLHRGPEILATFGKVSNTFLQKFDIEQDVFSAEIRWEACIRATQSTETVFEPMSKYPSIERDLALVLDSDVSYGEVESVIYATEKKLIREVDLFDVYENEEQMGEGKKSYAVRMTFESYEKTLSDKEIDKRVQKVIRNLETRLNAKLR